MITIIKMEYILKNEKRVSRPWLKISTSKGDIEFPLSSDYDNEYYTKKFSDIEKLSNNAQISISYDFRNGD